MKGKVCWTDAWNEKDEKNLGKISHLKSLKTYTGCPNKFDEIWNFHEKTSNLKLVGTPQQQG